MRSLQPTTFVDFKTTKHGKGKEGAANRKLVYGCPSSAIPDACFSLANWSGYVWTCPDFRFHASTVQHSVRITQNLSKHTMPEATIVTICAG
ncbi:hypothetical protein T4B_13425 [Trichinella pseudospiralis]|uniref:Uncharacterized protein n=2 Tax=Trichinella pseudospiralis TaxID=6337 RepID=A0A0V1J677_TRIPS|nr:hypothetical protein T4A_1491 [Trichinella pseudospiralis]KRY92795.1 hypothetical protein T4D_1704 [Trichinella pseudospiralis]KRZ30466.1 hypothetical protein T4B_13425 [Trichinella pseudospiralis]KRZ42627.1 hypothetical protein T4C_11261 [Trichinella pseudospiralis]